MNSKKVQAEMQVNVSFLGNTTKLVKQLENTTKQLNLDGSFTKQIGADLNKSFKEVYTNLNKMTEGLSKKGLSTKQYTAFFNDMNARLKDSIKFTQDLKKNLQTAFNSPENKQALKDLEKYKKQLEEIRKLAASQKGANTRRDTAIRKMADETGIDYNLSKRMLTQIANRKANNQGLTKNQQDWAAANGLDETKLKRVLELLKQINSQSRKQRELNDQAKALTGQATVDGAEGFLIKNIKNLSNDVITPEMSKRMAVVGTTVQKMGEDLAEVVDNHAPKLEVELSNSEKEAQKLAMAGSTLNEIFAQFGISFSIASIIKGFQDLIKSSFEFYKSLDSALNEIYVVSNLTSEAVDNLKGSFISMAKDTGMALDDITRSAVLFYQQGLNTNEVMEMTKVTSEFAKVAGIDATEAADKLTAAVNGYCLAAEDAALVADKFNKVAAASAADIDELSTAFSKAAAQANQAGVGMDNYLAYIATMVEATREAPENIGTSLKTIMSRMQQVKEAGSTEDGDTDVNQVETALRSVGVALRDTKGELRDLEEVFAELGPKWSSLDRNTQAYLGTIIAGTRQQSRFITLMQNWDRVLELSEDSANSAGQQALMHAKAMESIESKVQQFQVAWQEFISNLTESSIIKGVITTFTKLLDIFNDGNKPVALLAAAIGLLGHKLKDLQGPIVNKAKDIFGAFTKGGKVFTSDGQKAVALQTNKNSQAKLDDDIKKATEAQKKAVMELNALRAKGNAQTAADQERITHLAKKESALQTEINNKTKESTKLKREEKQIDEGQVMTKGQIAGKALTGVGMALSTIGIMASEADANVGGVISTIGTAATSIGQFASGNWVGGIVSGVTAIYQAWQTYDNWDENKTQRINDAVEGTGKALTDLVNTNTKVRSTEELIDTYDKLSNKVYKTAAEQEQLNSTIQEMGDTFGIDTVTDAYGNLSINIAQVRAELQALKDEQAAGLLELTKAEKEGKDNVGSWWVSADNDEVEAYYDEYITQYKSDLRSLLMGIEDGLDDTTRDVSSTLYQTINTAFKEAILDEVTGDNGYLYNDKGIAQSLKDFEASFNEKMGSTDWNYFYSGVEELQSKVNDLNWNEFQANLDDMFGDWWQKIGLTEQEWLRLKGVIETTVYGTSQEYQDFMSTYTTQGTKHEQATANKNAAYDDLQKKWDELGGYIDLYQDEETGEWIQGTLDDAIWFAKQYGGMQESFSGFKKAFKDDAGLATEDGNLGAGWSNIGIDDRSGNDYDNAMKLAAAINNYIEAEEKEDEANKAATESIEAQLANVMAEVKGDKVGALTGLSSAWDFSDFTTTNDKGEEVTDEGAKQAFADVMKDAITYANSNPDWDTENEMTTAMINYLTNVDTSQLSDSVKQQIEDVITEATGNLDMTGTFTWGGIFDSLSSYSEDLQTTNKALAELSENGSMAQDTFGELASTMDSLNFEDVFASFSDAEEGLTYIEGLCDALENLDVAYDANTGSVTMNAESLNYLQDAQERATKGKIKNMIADLAASKASAESQVAYIEAQIAAVDAMINYINTQGDAKINTADMMEAADSAYTTSFAEEMSKVSNSYSTITGDNVEWARTTIYNIGKVTDAWSKYWQAVRNGDANAGDLYKAAQEVSEGYFSSESDFEKGSNIKISDYDGVQASGEKGKELLASLETYKTGLRTAQAEYSKTVSLYAGQISYLESLANSDLSKWGADGSGDGEKLDQYIGKLKEIYNILNRIQVLEHRLGTLETYSDIAEGDQYGKYFNDRVKLTEELTDQYRFLTEEQKKFTNGYKDFIESSEVADVFDFDEFGQIIIDFEKYNKLQDTAADGEKSLKEQADELYDTYTSMYEELHGYFDDYISYLQKTIDLQQEMVDSYIDIEKQAADAIKEIYKKILDTKLEAIDQEKEALEELKEAREQSRKDQENAKAISNLQTNIQRTMMDSSGASDISFIKAQQDMNDKLEDIADDKYSEMLDNIIQRLDEEKDALQENFDEMFDNLDWLHQAIEEDMMTNEERLMELFQQTDEWKQLTSAERKQQVDEWSTQMATYMETIQGGKTIMDVCSYIDELQKKTEEMDNVLKTTISNTGTQVANAVANGIQSAYKSGYNAGGGGNTGGTGNKGTTTNPTGSPTTPSENPGGKTYTQETTVTETDDIKMKQGDKIEFRPATDRKMKVSVYDENGNPIDTYQNGWGDKNGTAGEVKSINGMRIVYFKPAGGYIETRHFQKKGSWGESTRYYLHGGLVDSTGPAWLDGTKQRPEAVLNALQTEHFIKFTNALDHMFSNGNVANTSSTVSIDTISFNVESMSSPEDGEAAFNMFVNKFKEIGNRTGIKIDTFKNTL